MLKIWGRANSINVMKVLWVCEELGLPYERIDAGMQYGRLDTPEFGRMNPNRRVPTIEDPDSGGETFALSESNTIVRYLAAREGSHDLLPADLRRRADVERWMDWCSTSLAPPMTPLFWQLVRTPAEQRDTSVIGKSASEAERCMRILEEVLGARDWLAGDAFTVADIPAGAFVHRWLHLPQIELPKLPAVVRYRERLLERPGYRKHVAVALS